jgi:nitroreductase
MTTPAGPSSEPSSIVRPLLRTRQIREFTDEPLGDDALDAVADVARWTGSASNQQPWRFLVLTDVPTLRRLGEIGLPQTRSLATAPAALVITLPAGADRETRDAYDDGRVAERVLVAASMLGIGAGIAWIRKDTRDAVNELLGIPDDRYVRTVVALGHPTEGAKRPKGAPGTARLPREETVFRDRWPG